MNGKKEKLYFILTNESLEVQAEEGGGTVFLTGQGNHVSQPHFLVG